MESGDAEGRSEAEQRADEATSVADQDVEPEAEAVVHGPEGQGGAAGAAAPNGGVTGADPDAPRE